MTVAAGPHVSIAPVSTSGGTSSAIDTTGQNFIAFAVSIYQGFAGNLAVSDSKINTWTKLTPHSSTIAYSVIFYCKNPTVGTGHTFTLGSGSIAGSACISTFSGVDITSPFDVQNGATGSGTTLATGSVTPTNAGSLFIAALSTPDNTTTPYSIDSSFTITDTVSWSSGVREGCSSAYKVSSSAENPTWTVNSATNPLAAAIVAFKAATGGGTTYNQSCLATCTPVASLVRQTGKTLIGGSTPLGGLLRSTGKLVLSACTPPSSLVRQTNKPLAASNVPIASESGIKTKIVTALATTTPVSSINRLTGKIVLATVMPVASLQRSTGAVRRAANSAAASLNRRSGKGLQASSSPAGTLGAIKTKLVSALASTAPVASITRQIGKSLLVSTSPAARLGRVAGKLLRATNSAIAVCLVNGGAIVALINPRNYRKAEFVRRAIIPLVARARNVIGLRRSINTDDT